LIKKKYTFDDFIDTVLRLFRFGMFMIDLVG